MRNTFLFFLYYGYDYIGAPHTPDVIKNLNLNIVNSGNGGFSLRKISSMLKLLSYGLDNKKLDNYKTLQNIYSLKRKKHLLSNIINIPYFLYCWIFQYFLNWRFMHNEDLIIAYYAAKYYPDFKIADNKTAAKFALEYNAKEMYYSPDYELPFGAHNPIFYIFLIYKEAVRKELTK